MGENPYTTVNFLPDDDNFFGQGVIGFRTDVGSLFDQVYSSKKP